jgi:hypothetical protein
MRISLLVALALLGISPAWAAEEPSGCDKFKWPIEHERAVLTAPDRLKLASGAELAALPSQAVILALRSPAEAKLPMPPERAPKEGTFAGFANVTKMPKAGLYSISLSAADGWMSCRKENSSSRRRSVAPPTATASARL